MQLISKNLRNDSSQNENQEFTFFLINDIKKYIQIQI